MKTKETSKVFRPQTKILEPNPESTKQLWTRYQEVSTFHKVKKVILNYYEDLTMDTVNVRPRSTYFSHLIRMKKDPRSEVFS